jgi:hypothetical protein
MVSGITSTLTSKISHKLVVVLRGYLYDLAPTPPGIEKIRCLYGPGLANVCYENR